MPTTDYTHTNNPRSIYLAEMALPFPEWIKGQPIPERKDLEKLASVAFADRSNRLLPVHEKEASFFSSLDYFANAGDYPEETFDAIKEACEHFGIGADVAPYAEFFAGVFEKQASEESVEVIPGRFAISTQLNGHDFQILPLNDPYEVSKSARELLKMAHEDRVHYLMLVDAAREIVKAASEIGSDQPLPGLVLHVGSPRFEDLDKAASLIETRRPLSKGFDGAYEAYTSAIKEAAEGKITAEECMQKIAATDDIIGIKYNFSPRTRTPLPHDIVFGGPSYSEVEKEAASRVIIRGVPVPFGVMSKIPKSDVEFKMEKAAASEFLQLRDGGSAIPLSLAIEKWAADDQKELLRLAVDFADV